MQIATEERVQNTHEFSQCLVFSAALAVLHGSCFFYIKQNHQLGSIHEIKGENNRLACLWWPSAMQIQFMPNYQT